MLGQTQSSEPKQTRILLHVRVMFENRSSIIGKKEKQMTPVDEEGNAFENVRVGFSVLQWGIWCTIPLISMDNQIP